MENLLAGSVPLDESENILSHEAAMDLWLNHDKAIKCVELGPMAAGVLGYSLYFRNGQLVWCWLNNVWLTHPHHDAQYWYRQISKSYLGSKWLVIPTPDGAV